MNRIAYLDYNATAPVRPEVVAVIAEALEYGGNPSSVHAAGRVARRAVEDARERIAALVGASPADVIFTSGGTEANNLALGGNVGRRLIVSAVEHGSVLGAAFLLDPHTEVVPVDSSGVIDLGALERALATNDRPAVVALMLANNETGAIQPVAEAASIAHRFDALLHCDAVQPFGKIPLAMPDLGADLLSLSAHKMGGPQGVGALVKRPSVAIKARAIGGGQERGWRAGTENVAGIVGFARAAELALADLDRMAEIGRLRDALEARLRAVTPRATVFGAGAERLPNTSCLSMPDVGSETQVIALDLAGVAVSAGAACSSGKVARSHVLQAMGLADAEASSAIRVSLGWRSTSDDIDRFVGAWTALYARTRPALQGDVALNG
ncbi:MAG: cysteine desulfurase [Alphaproteobacteria bacterium]|nr:cysteine desulfurase [Alphaproteobacteria bacterium]